VSCGRDVAGAGAALAFAADLTRRDAFPLRQREGYAAPPPHPPPLCRRGGKGDGGSGMVRTRGAAVGLLCDGSGWAGGRCLEWIDWWFADEEAEDLAEFVSFQMQPVHGAAELPVLLPNEGLLAVGLFLHHSPDVAAEVMHELEQPVPEAGGAEAGDDGEVAADVGDGAADAATAHLKIEFLRCGHEEFGIVPAWG
jgi:hypothetical protein